MPAIDSIDVAATATPYRPASQNDATIAMHTKITGQAVDYRIPVDDARALLALCVGGLVDKRRHLVRHGGHLWEVDEFLGDNTGLVVAEIELDHADAAFERPDWLGSEVTDDPRYYNLALASHPYTRWAR